ncbi:phosphatases II [Massarina eburnea CBS 473.64]|uniref:Phosphatases II n=1 Tax=Massarina eburnea CBS 473.64 TaxID=1395130 RepID=A0A6A6S9P2_9PLEO|nr:phosphatases II [Massarina eburnea CBS 473.64]
MSYLLHGSSAYTLMGWVDRVPRAGALFIGGLYALYQTDLIRAAGITHVLSVIDYDPLLQEKFKHLKHLHIRADDDPNEDLLKHFEEVCRYIDKGLNGPNGEKGGVFVHCAMGKSRSATLVVAYLMWKFGVGWKEGLEQLCEGRPVCDPNPGFKEQLAVWERLLKCSGELERKNTYEEWAATRFMGTSWEWEARSKMLKDEARQGQEISKNPTENL